MIPDADAIAFRLHVPYAGAFGHRGAAHSLLAALLVGLAAWQIARVAGWNRLRLSVYACLSVASHGLLDAMTTGGQGVALFWPFSARRYFLPWRPIPVSPIGTAMLSARGLHVLAWEALVFAPCWLYALRRTGVPNGPATSGAGAGEGEPEASA